MLDNPKAAVQEFADTCIRCGVCSRTDCGNYGPDTPTLGDICESLLNGEEEYRHFAHTCALCNRCTVNCPVDLKASNALKPARALVLEKYPDIRPLYRKFRTDLKWNLFSSLKALRSGDIENITYIDGEKDLENDQANHTAFFSGCALYAYQPELTQRVSDWLRDNNVAAHTLYFCCGATFYDPGFFEEFKEYRKKAQEFLAEHEIEHLVVTCPHCAHELPELLEGTSIDISKLSQIMVEHDMTSEFEGTFSIHDSCYDRDEGKFGDFARALYPHAQEKPMQHSRCDTLCCGGGGLVSAYAPSYCEYRRNQRLAEIDDVQADRVLSTCFSCVNSLQRGIGATPVQHYLEPVFDVETDWGEVYCGVDELYADPRYAELTSDDNDERTFD